MDTDTTALERLADDVVTLVAERGAAAAPHAEVEANVGVVRNRHGLTRFANSFVHQHVGEDTVTVSITLAVDGRTTTTSTTSTDRPSLSEAIDAAIASAGQQPVDPHWPGATPPTDVPASAHFDPDTAAGEPTGRAERVRAFVDAGPELDAAGYVDTEATWAAFASTAEHRAADASTRATLDGIHQTARSAGSAHQTSIRSSDLDGATAGALAAELARDSAEFEDVEPGAFDVVLGPEAVAAMLTFLGVYGFNAKTHLEGGSFAELGEAQFDPSVTILDDPEDPRAVGLGFDAEGSPRRRVALVEGGVTRAVVHDRRTAKRADTVSTGGAIPGGETFGAVPLNVRMLGGQASPQDLVASVERGLLITSFHYVRVLEPKTQLATGLTRNGTFRIEDGKVAGAVGNLRFTESFLDALGSGRVLGVGNDDRLADGGLVTGMVTCPSLRLRSFTFTGGAGG
ncbi:TldD/PmbA family protein [Egibacter rhizosphaerae]|uniref:TldD/PmbA family protein n=1 Tax=Egibacter rhizosphaerae TaxID=1670831 RepID=A0A411YC36_9ACTN|nr:metallopeptidase TldD-related protein [Egibacter rhizosphaerae]QBI18769.1 TldD/PmbA family protein [Egibacter rhizosphaerae]